jgi:hypothetical protein
MDRKRFGVISLAIVVAPALAAPSAAAAESSGAPAANSYADLLEPIPNATEKLRLADLQEARQPARLIRAGWEHHHHHHHHHHYSYWGAPVYYGYEYSYPTYSYVYPDYGVEYYYDYSAPYGYGYYYGHRHYRAHHYYVHRHHYCGC